MKLMVLGVAGVVILVGCALLTPEEQEQFNTRLADLQDEIAGLELDRAGGQTDPVAYDEALELLKGQQGKIVRDMRALEEQRIKDNVKEGAKIANAVGGLATFLPIPGVPIGGALLQSLAGAAIAWAERKKQNGEAAA